MAILKSSRLYVCLVLGVGSVLVLCFMSFKDKLIVEDDIGPVGPLNIVMPESTSSAASFNGSSAAPTGPAHPTGQTRHVPDQ